jgi:TrmH family RNA methyltransferase
VTGRKLISEAVKAGFAVENVFIDAGALAHGEAAIGECEDEIVLDERLFRELASTVTPQPYIAVVRRSDADAIRGEVKQARRILILDRVGDPGNAGTMIRSALAAGMDGVWCVKGTADVFSEKAMRASAGAVFHLPVREGLSARMCVNEAREIGARLLVCSAEGADIYETDLTGCFALVIGNEGDGPQKEFLDAADAVVGIPMEAAAESLNAAIAAAVVMYEARRQESASKRLKTNT